MILYKSVNVKIFLSHGIKATYTILREYVKILPSFTQRYNEHH